MCKPAAPQLKDQTHGETIARFYRGPWDFPLTPRRLWLPVLSSWMVDGWIQQLLRRFCDFQIHLDQRTWTTKTLIENIRKWDMTLPRTATTPWAPFSKVPSSGVQVLFHSEVDCGTSLRLRGTPILHGCRLWGLQSLHVGRENSCFVLHSGDPR